MRKDGSGEFYNAKQDNVFSEYKLFRAEKYYSSEFSKTPEEVQSYNESYHDEGVKSTKSEEKNSSDAKELQKQYDKLHQSGSSDAPQTSGTPSGGNPLQTTAASQTAGSVSSGVATVTGGASVGATAVAAVIIVSAAITGGFIADFNSYIGNDPGRDYISITVDMDELLSQADRSYRLSADNFSIELTEGGVSRKIALVDGKHSYLITGLQPDKTYTYNFICNNFSLGSNSNCYSQTFTTLSVAEPKGVYDELNNYVVYDEISQSATVFYSVYLSDYDRQFPDAALYLCSSEHTDLTSIDHIVYSDVAPDENGFFRGEVGGITYDELYLYVVGESTTEDGTKAVELFSIKLTLDIPEEWQAARNPAFEIDESAEKVAYYPDRLSVSGSISGLNELYDYYAYVVQYDAGSEAFAERQEADFTFDTEKMTYALDCGACYGLKNYKYVIYAQDGDGNEVTVYDSGEKVFSASQAFGATYTKIEPANAEIEYTASGAIVTVDPEFTSEYENYYYKLVVTNGVGAVYGEYAGTGVAVIEIADVTGLDEIHFTYHDFGSFINGEIEYASHLAESVAFCLPKASFGSECGFNGQYFTLSYACDMIYDYATASMDISVSDGTHVYVKHVDGIAESGTIVLDHIEGEVGNVTVTGTLNFKDNQSDGATHSVSIDQAVYAMNYSLEVTNVLADISGFSSETMLVTLELEYRLPENYVIAISDEDNSLSFISDLTRQVSFSELPMEAEANLTVQVMDGNGNVWGAPKTISISPSAAWAEFVYPMMCSPNPGDAVVTYNDDGTINIYRMMIPDEYGMDTVSGDERVYYNAFVQGFYLDSDGAVYTDGYDVIGRGKYAVIENIPNQNYFFIYYTMFDYNGVSYAMYAEMPSGSVENVYECGDAIVSYGDGNTIINLMVIKSGMIANYILVNGVEYEFDSYTDESDTDLIVFFEGEAEVREVTILFTAQGYNYDEYAASGEITMKGNKYASHVIQVIFAEM